MTADVELGTKHECPSCGTKYYDLGKAGAPCPKCGASQEETEPDQTKTSRKKA
ncbi:MAG: FYDLN acid domain-containing protein [Acidobacteria bacterium]|nr:FYDLN acid domain-containing protein [Acidobacteriota bacterium]